MFCMPFFSFSFFFPSLQNRTKNPPRTCSCSYVGQEADRREAEKSLVPLEGGTRSVCSEKVYRGFLPLYANRKEKK